MIRVVTFLCLMSSTHLQAQNILTHTNFPDPNFNNALVDLYPAGLTEVEASQVLALNVESKNIIDLTGLEFFTGLEQLIVRGNQITELPNLAIFRNLESLHCRENQLTHLNGIVQLSNLQELQCGANPISSIPDISNSLIHLNATVCPITEMPWLEQAVDLQHLDISYMELTALPDLRGLTELITFSCANNRISGSILLPAASNLESIHIQSNFISALPDLSGLVNLKQIVFDDNIISEFPDLSTMNQLSLVWCVRNLLSAADCPNIEVVQNMGISFLFSIQGNFKSYYSDFPSWPADDLLLDLVDVLTNQSWLYTLDCSNP